MKCCTAENCNRAAIAKGFCGKHYQRLWKRGSLDARQYGGGYIKAGYHLISGARAHVVVAERALGRAIPPGAVVHHANGDKKDNRPANLVICPSRAYHNLLHQRMDALAACGHADWRRCPRCLRYSPPSELLFYATGIPRHPVSGGVCVHSANPKE